MDLYNLLYISLYKGVNINRKIIIAEK